MASREDTAANELVARISGGEASKPSARVAATALPGEAAAVAPVGPPGMRATAALPLPSPPEPHPMHTTLPVTMPVAAPFEPRPASLAAPYPVVSRSTFEPAAPVVAPPGAAHGPPAAGAPWTSSPAAPAAPAAAAWAEPTQLIERRHRPPRPPQHVIGTLRMRHSDLRIVVGKLVLPMVLLVIAGIVIGGYVVFSSDGKPGREVLAARATAPTPEPPAPIAPVMPAAPPTPVAGPDPETAPAANPASAAPPVAAVAAVAEPAVAAVAAVAEPAVVPPETTQTSMLVDVRIDSTPSGAAVTLVDRGKSQFVGNTPVNATVDASLEYDLVFAYPNKPAQVEHLDARTTRHVAVTLGARAAAARMDSAPPHVDKPSAGSVPAPVKPPAKAIEPAGEGTLMISSKPPCEIVIDGKPTGLTTPQRAITLPAGNHKITLVNSSDQAIRRTVSVQIMANTTEKVIEDLMK